MMDISPEQLPDPEYSVDRELIERAAEVIRPYGLNRTRMLHSPWLSEICGRPVHLKCESEQLTGSFKIRGALARLASPARDELIKGVVAASAGNHGLGIAWACRTLGFAGLVVIPESTPRVKSQRLEEMMIKLRRHGSCYDEAEAYARDLAQEAEATFVSPFDDPWVIAGNGGTVGLEILDQLPGCTGVVAPVGGGGLASGLAIAMADVPVLGVNTAASPAMARSLAEGEVHLTFASAPTLAEGLEGGVSATTMALCGLHLHGIETVSEESIERAIAGAAHNHRIVLEGSAATAIAALLEGKPLPGSGPLCVVLTGRNIDHARLRDVLTRHPS